MLKNAILPNSDQPAILLWGFRPTYADIPAFRQRSPGDIELFSADDEPVYDRLVSQNKSESDQNAINRDGAFVILNKTSYLYAHRNDIQDRTQDAINMMSVSLLGLANTSYGDTLRTVLLDNHDNVSTVLLRVLTQGRVQMAEEQVIDSGDERFISGPRVPFDQSFVPLIANLLSDADIPQLVIIFKPVSATRGELDEGPAQFADDAADYFQNNNIPYINFVEDPSIGQQYYAKGDHYNADGRIRLTEIIAAKLRTIIESEQR